MNIRPIILIVVAVFISVVVLLPVGKRTQAIKKINENIQILEQEEKELKAKKEKLEEEIRKLSSEENVETVARDKLNMKKEGERVYKFVEEEKKSEK